MKLAVGKETLEVVQVGPDSIWVVNNDTGVATRLPTDTLRPDRSERHPESKGKLDLVTGGGETYLVDRRTGGLKKLDGKRGGRGQVGTPPISAAVVDSTGTAWAYSAGGGELLEIDGTTVKGRQQVAAPGEAAALTLVSDAPVIYRQTTGQAALYGSGGLRRQVDLGARNGVVSQPGTASPLVAVVVPSTGVLTTGDFNSRHARNLRLPGREGHTFDAPVVHHGRVYIPDLTELQVLIADLATGKVRQETVESPSNGFQLTVRDDRVWVNDPKSPVVISFDSSGRKTSIDVDGAGGLADNPLPTPSPTRTVLPVRQPPPVTAAPKVSRPSASPTPRREVVPDVVGLPREQACARLRPEFRCLPVAQSGVDGQAETDTVLATDPAAGSRAARGSAVTVLYRGPVTVPAVVGVPAAQACEALLKARLKCAQRSEGLAKAAAQVGVVTAQDPRPDTPAATGTTVTVVSPAQVEVGTFTGRPVAEACAAVQQAGLACAQQESGQGAPTAVVQTQTPAAGAGLPPGGTVTVTYLGEPVVPNLVGQPPDAACALLRQAQLECAPNDNEPTLDLNKVHGQDPAPGARLAAGKPVTFTFESTAPTPLLRYKSPAPNRANFISAGGAGPAGWSSQSTLGQVYRADQVGSVPGVVPIYQFRCQIADKCREPGSYYFSQGSGNHAGFVLEGPAFACFQNPVPGTRELHALMNGEGTWVWAVPGSAEYQHFTSTGFGSKYDFRVCNIW
ncbi:PASTA domain-containing protein [Sphaerisporangium sp. B11E5]|uniref:PASTA domain-containing protein n=1 Tax=Sphaerisporangium sp. B11E5 TaxID=3153563 RepID=UPI00325DCF14